MSNAFPIEDSVSFRSALVEILRTHFPLHRDHEASNASEGLRKIQQLRPGLIDMDIQLPRENGQEVTRQIKLVYEDIVINIVTSCSLPEYHQNIDRNGIDSFFAKKKDSSTKGTPAQAKEPLAVRSYH